MHEPQTLPYMFYETDCTGQSFKAYHKARVQFPKSTVQIFDRELGKVLLGMENF